VLLGTASSNYHALAGFQGEKGARVLDVHHHRVLQYVVSGITGEVPMKTVSLKLAEPLLRKLERLANERGRSKSDLIRSALEQYLNGDHSTVRGSFLEAAGAMIGCVEGPADLSYHADHMKGFGT
jgi:Ribbon-helix-helix protein, copG family